MFGHRLEQSSAVVVMPEETAAICNDCLLRTLHLPASLCGPSWRNSITAAAHANTCMHMQTCMKTLHVYIHVGFSISTSTTQTHGRFATPPAAHLERAGRACKAHVPATTQEPVQYLNTQATDERKRRAALLQLLKRDIQFLKPCSTRLLVRFKPIIEKPTASYCDTPPTPHPKINLRALKAKAHERCALLQLLLALLLL